MAKSPISSGSDENEPAAASTGRLWFDGDEQKRAQSAADRMEALQRAIEALLERSDSEIAAAEREADALLAAAEELEVETAIASVLRRC